VKNQRSTLIVDKSFQYSLIIPVVTMAVLATNSVLLAIFFLIGSEFSARLQTFIWLVAVIEVLFIVVAIFHGARASNRIAGPIYRLKKVMRMLADGDLNCRIRLRKHDHLQDLAGEINDMLRLMDARVQALQVATNTIREQAGKQQAGDDNHLDTALLELERLVGEFKISNAGL